MCFLWLLLFVCRGNVYIFIKFLQQNKCYIFTLDLARVHRKTHFSTGKEVRLEEVQPKWRTSMQGQHDGSARLKLLSRAQKPIRLHREFPLMDTDKAKTFFAYGHTTKNQIGPGLSPLWTHRQVERACILSVTEMDLWPSRDDMDSFCLWARKQTLRALCVTACSWRMAVCQLLSCTSLHAFR